MSYGERPSRSVYHRCPKLPYTVPSGGSRKHPEGVLVATLVIFALIGFANLCIMLYNGVRLWNETRIRTNSLRKMVLYIEKFQLKKH